jgi:hypothetical protein
LSDFTGDGKVVDHDGLLGIMRDAKDPDALINAESALSQRHADLDSLRAQREALGDRIDYSTVDVTFVAEQIGGPAPKQYEGFTGQIERGWDGLVSVLGNAVLLFGLLLPWLGMLIVVAGILYLVAAWRGRGDRSSPRMSGGAANAPLEEHLALRLAQAAPDAVGLTDAEGVGTALRDHGATPAHLLGAHLALRAGPATLAVGMEEHR